MTVGDLIEHIGKYEFIEISGDTLSESPTYAGRLCHFHEEPDYKIICTMPVIMVGLAEDEDRNGYGILIYYDDRGLN